MNMELKEALTPPTAEEVCEALGKHLGGTFIYDNGMFYEYTNKKIVVCFLHEKWNEHSKNYELNIHFSLDSMPLRIVTIISRFYEGIKQN